jgi:hypothetical protein
MAAFYAAMEVQPKLQPQDEETLEYVGSPGGAKIEVRYVDTELQFN